MRLNALFRYSILDTPDEPAFDRLTALAVRLFKVPVALVTLVDENRQWFKSRVGFPLRETDRDISFCAHAILEDSVMVVRDAGCDTRFADNPLVTGEIGLRFYAGAPLKVLGKYNLGTLCIVDRIARDFPEHDQQLLRELAAIAADELGLRLANKENRQLTTAISKLKSGVVVADPNSEDCPITYANPGFSAITGYPVEECVGMNCRFLQGRGTDPEMLKEIHDCLVHGRHFTGTILNYRKDGSPFWNELTITPVLDKDGKLINFVGLQTDVTERRNLEATRDSLTHMIIHDLRNPISVVLGYLNILRREGEGKLSSRDLRMIETACGSADMLDEMVTNLLDVHRLESGEMPLDIHASDLCSIVTGNIEAASSIKGPVKITASVPPQPMIVHCDRVIIWRILNNLLANALKFTADGGRIEVTLTQQNQRAVITVSDDGIGIPPEYHDRIFEKFGQVPAQRRTHSTGLGLTFSKLAAEAHGGSISIQSEPGKGSTFTVTLPLGAHGKKTTRRRSHIR
jgi:PAS domain S-box-containing protein